MTLDRKNRQSTADAMHDTAEELERSEAALHNAADRSPAPDTTRRLDAIGDEVTRQAKKIDKRATHLEPSNPDSADGVRQGN